MFSFKNYSVQRLKKNLTFIRASIEVRNYYYGLCISYSTDYGFTKIFYSDIRDLFHTKHL